MRKSKATSASWCRSHPGRVLGICIALAGFGLPPAFATDIQDHSGVGILTDFRQGNEQVRKIFDGTAVINEIGSRASQFARRDSTRYALVAFPVRGNIKPERIGEPYCRGQLLTPEQTVFEDNISQQVNDKLVSKSLFKAWRSKGQIVNSKVLTRRIPDKDFAVSFCRVQEADVKGIPVTLTASDIRAARVTVADATFTSGQFKAAARRYHDLYEDDGDATLLMKEVISLLESGDLDAGFARDEVLHSYLKDIEDLDLLERYENAMSKAVIAYMTVPSPITKITTP